MDDEARDTIERFHDALNRRDLDALSDLISDDCVFEATSPAPDGTRHVGRQAVLEACRVFFAGSPTTHFEMEEMFGPGEETCGVSVVTAPTMPIFCPPTSSTTEGLMRSPTLEAALAFTFALSTGNLMTSRNGARAFSPSSNSWLPTVMASNFIWFRNSASTAPL